MKAFTQPLQEMAEYGEIARQLGKKQGIIQISGCIDSQKAHLVHGFSENSKCQLIIAADDQKAKEFYEDYRFYAPEVLLYPAKDLLFYRTDIQGNLIIKRRMQVIQSILQGEHPIVVTSINGCMDYLQPLETIRKNLIHIKNDDTLDLEQLKMDLVSLGYERTAQVEMSGQFAVRGAIVDIFPLTEENPWRMELWGDEIDSLRSFDVESQRSLENLEEITIYPATELEPQKDKVTFVEYFPKKDTIIYLDELNRITEAALGIQEEFQESVKNRAEAGHTELHEDMLRDYKAVYKDINSHYCVALCTIEQNQKDWKIIEKYDLTVQSLSGYNNSFDLLVRDLAAWKRQKYRVVLLSGSRTRASRLAEDLRDNDLHAFYSEDYDRMVQPGEIMVVYGHARRGFEYPMVKFVVITESDILDDSSVRKRRKKITAVRRFRTLQSFQSVIM